MKNNKARDWIVRGFFASLFGAIVVSCSGCGGGGGSSSTASTSSTPGAPQAVSQPTSAPAVAKAAITPESDYRAIAAATLPANASSTDIDAREVLVKQWIADNGGDVIYQNYLATYAAPSDARQNYYVSDSNVSSQQLGYYYLAHPLSSADDTTWYTCVDLAPKAAGSPTLQAECALDQWDAFKLTGNVSYAQALVSAADGFLTSNVNGQYQWTAETMPSFGITSTPWISALTQGMAVSVLLRAYQYTGQTKYLTAAADAYHWIAANVSQGGTMTSTIGTWLEEYPNQTIGAESGHVLNGDVWALFGVWDYYRVTGDAGAYALAEANIQSIKSNINWYDLGYWNVYSHLNQTDTVNGLYMHFIFEQMRVLGYMTGDSFFSQLAAKWQADQQNDALFVHNLATAYLQAHPQ